MGRPELKRMLDSLKSEAKEGDAITVVFDGPEAPKQAGYTDAWKEGFSCPVNVITEPVHTGHWSHVIRNKYLTKLSPRTTFIMQGDDDDEYIPGFLQGLREVCTDSSVFYIAKMTYSDNRARVVPTQDKEIISADIGTPCGIVPWDMAGKGEWSLDYSGDYQYFKGVGDAVGKEKTKFLPNIIYLVNK